jgi:hypothetical protein
MIDVEIRLDPATRRDLIAALKGKGAVGINLGHEKWLSISNGGKSLRLTSEEPS